MSFLNLTPKKLIVGAAIPMAVLASGGMVWQSSYSAFSATTASPTNNWSAGTVALSDDDSNTAMFTATNLKPGATGTKCIAVTSTGSLASTVKLYGTAYDTTNALAANINLKVEEGTGATTASCTGFTAASTLYDGAMSTFGTTKTSFATGVAAGPRPAAPPPRPTGSPTRSARAPRTPPRAAPRPSASPGSPRTADRTSPRAHTRERLHFADEHLRPSPAPGAGPGCSSCCSCSGGRGRWVGAGCCGSPSPAPRSRWSSRS